MGDSIWNFISSVYSSNWNSFFTDNKSNTLRAKLLSKFTLKIPLSTNKNNKEASKPVLVTIKKVLPPHLSQQNQKERSTSFSSTFRIANLWMKPRN